MKRTKPIRIFMTGVGGQGTLTATTLLARAALAAGFMVTAGEIHGMAQRGGVVESMLLIGLCSPRIGPGEADILLGFEPLETLRAMPYLKPGGLVLSSSEFLPPLAVAMGRQACPDLDSIRARVEACAGRALFLPCQGLGLAAGALQSGNTALIGALAALRAVPVTLSDLEAAIGTGMKPKIAEINLRALALGAAAVANA